MGPGADLADAESIAAHAGGDAFFHSPEHRIVIVAVRGNVGEGALRLAGSLLAEGRPEEGHDLLPSAFPSDATASDADAEPARKTA